jgi:hypothetical protein
MADKKISALTGATTPLAGTEVLPIVQGGATVKVAVSDLTAGRDVAGKTLALSNGTGSYSTEDLAYLVNNSTAQAVSRLKFGTSALANNAAVGGYTFDANNGSLFLYAKSGGTLTTGAYLWHTLDFRISSGNVAFDTAAKGINFTANTPAAGMTSQLLNWYEEGTWTPVVSGVSLITPLGTYVKIGKKVFANFTFSSTGAVSSDPFLISGLPFTPNTGATEADRPAGYLTFNGGAVKSWTLLFGSAVTTVAFRQDPGGTTGTITDLSGLTLWGTIIYTST